MFLRIYFAGWCVWTVYQYYRLGILKLDNISMGLLLGYGMLKLNDQFLAVFAFWNLLPFVVSITVLLDYIFSLGKSQSQASTPISYWIYQIADSLIVLLGIKIAYDSFKIFRAERLGFPMEGEFDIS